MNDSKKTLHHAAAWIGGSQIIMRLVRIISTIVVARLIAPDLLGVAAIVLAVNELAHVFVRNATNGRIIRSKQYDLPALSDSAYFLNWIFGFGLFILQCFAGLALSKIYSDPIIFNLVCTLGFSYLLLPFAQVHSALNLRSEKIALISKTEVQQTVIDALLTITMVLMGFGVWSLVLPKLLVIPIWIKAHRQASSWRSPTRFTLQRWSDHLHFNSQVVGVEVLSVIRHNIDYVVIGLVLGMEALGIYYFAYNAGLGLSRGFIISLNNAFYPHLCAAGQKASDIEKRFNKGLLTMLCLMVPLLALQALLAKYYVPVLFGQHWVELGAALYVSLLCMAGVPLLITEAGSQYARALGKPNEDLRWQSSYTVIFIVAVVVGVHWGLIGVVTSVLISQFVFAPLHFLLVTNMNHTSEHVMFAKFRGIVR